MPELERDLREVGRLIAFPPEPNLVLGVVGRLTERPRRRRPLVLALAVLAVSLAAAFAVPPAWTAILRFFHIGGETVERVNVLPPARHRPPGAGPAGPGRPSRARARAGLPPPPAQTPAVSSR